MTSDPTQAALEAELRRLVSQLPVKSDIYLPTGKLDLAERVDGLRKVVDVYKTRLDSVDRPRLREIRDEHQGRRRAFVIGNGPSLNRTDLSRLKNEVTFCVNGFFLKMPEIDWTPTFYVVEDHLVAEDRAAQINALHGPTKLFPANLAYCLDPDDRTVFFDHRPRPSYPHGFDFSTDASICTYAGCTVTFTCIQLAHYFGFEEICLIGVDADYTIPTDAKAQDTYGVGVLDMQSDDPNHFHPDYFGKGARWHDPQVDKMLEAYAEAERVTRSTGRIVMNATLGGKLEVFERVDYDDVAPGLDPPQDKDLRYPRVALFDLTPPGDGTATGELKTSLFGSWPPQRLLTVYALSQNSLAAATGANPSDDSHERSVTAGRARTLLDRFDPDVIIYRPTPDRPSLHKLAMEIAADRSTPLVTWIMDDWLRKLETANPDAHATMERDLRTLLERSSCAVAISEEMALDYTERFGVRFEVVANGVDRPTWENLPPRAPDGELVVRYAGSLAEDMSLASVTNVARAVSRLSRDHAVRMEILTRRLWIKQAGPQFAAFPNVSFYPAELSPAAYRRWLADADVLLVAYNFDQRTADYVRLSIANKLPECLAAGAAVLLVAPSDFATARAAASTGAVTHVDTGEETAIEAALRRLIDAPELRARLGEAGRAAAFEHFDLSAARAKFHDMLRGAAAQRPRTRRAPLPQELVAGDRRSRVVVFLSGLLSRAPAPLRPLLTKMAETVSFYRGWRALAALAILALCALWPLLADTSLGGVARWAPALGAAFAFLFFGRIFNSILKEIEELRSRLSSTPTREEDPAMNALRRDLDKALARLELLEGQSAPQSSGVAMRHSKRPDLENGAKSSDLSDP